MALSKVNATALAAGAAKSNFGAGAVLQVVQGTYNGTFSTSSSSYVATGLTASITPASTTSKVLVRANFPVQWGSTNYMQVALAIYRDGTNIYSLQNNQSINANINQTWPGYLEFLDSPSSGSNVTYSIYLANIGGAGQYLYPNLNSQKSTIILMEIAG